MCGENVMKEKKKIFKSRWGILLSIFVFVMLWSFSASADTIMFDGTLDYDKANQVLELLNDKRASLGLNRLVTNADIQEKAMQRAKELALYYSHTRPDNTKWSTILGDFSGWYGENAAMGQVTAEEVMTDWTNSSGHYANMIHSKFK